MKYTTALLLVLGLMGCDALTPAPKRACNRVATLCELSEADAKSCGEELTKLRDSLGPARMDQLATCVKESTSCAEAGGCMAGTSMAAIGDQLGKFLKGLGRTTK